MISSGLVSDLAINGGWGRSAADWTRVRGGVRRKPAQPDMPSERASRVVPSRAASERRSRRAGIGLQCSVGRSETDRESIAFEHALRG